MSTAGNEAAREKAKAIGQQHLRQPYKDETITKDEFKDILKKAARDAQNGDPPMDDHFEAKLRAKLDAEIKEAVAARAGNGNGHAANGNGDAMQVESSTPPQPPPPPMEQQQPPPPPPHLQQPSTPSPTETSIEQERRGVVRPRDEVAVEPPAQRQQLQNLAPLDRAAVALADLPAGIDGAPVALPTKIMEFAKRPGRGQSGVPLRIKANCTPIKYAKDLNVHQFDVRFNWIEDGAGGVSGGKGGIPDADSQAMFQHLGKLFGNGRVAYDGKKIVYAPQALPQLTAEAEAAGWSHSSSEPGSMELLFFTETIRKIEAEMLKPEHADAEQRAKLQQNKEELERKKVTLTAAKGDGERPDGVVLEMSRLVSGEDLGSAYRKYMAALDVMLRPFIRYKQVRGAFYDETAEACWANKQKLHNSGNVELWLGYRQSVVLTTNGPMLFIDTAAAAMHAPVKLTEFIAHKLGLNNARQLTLANVKGAEKHITSMMGGKRPKITCAHSNRQYTLAGIDNVPASEAMFFDSEVGETVSVAAHFARKYPQHRLELAHLPCVCVGKRDNPSKTKLPIELCKMVGGEPALATKTVTAEMISYAGKPPSERLDIISKVVSAKAGADTGVCAAPAFGVEVAPQIADIGARKLPSMRLKYMADANNTNRRREVEVEVHREKGEWNLRPQQGSRGDLGFMEPGEEVREWAAICFAEDRELPQRMFEAFVRMLQQMADQRGMRLGERPQIIYIRASALGGGGNFANRVGEEMERQIRSLDRVGLVLCAMPSDTTRLYPALKKWAETKTGIPLQCVRADKLNGRKAMATDPQYHAGVLLKLNLKLAGGNVHPVGEGLKLMRDKPTMVCGVDVYHPPPGSKEPSWCALVASMDVNCAKWHNVVDMQAQGAGGKDRQEVIPKLREHFLECLKTFFEVNKRPPERVIFYRDGVAHNQFEVVATQEIGEISKVLEEQGLQGKTELIFVVAQKKTNVRFGMVGGSQPFGSGKGKGKGGGKGGGGKGGGGGGGGPELGNVPPGTVVDNDITDAHGFDFYLVSQHALKGTARPTHFHVLTCPPWLSADAIQQFTFDLCHVYARCTKVASRPAPIYYAHLAAAHAPFYDKVYKDRTADHWETASSSSGGSGSSGGKSKSDFAPLHRLQRGRLYYC